MIQMAGQVKHARYVISTGTRVELVEKPKPLLGKRKWRIKLCFAPATNRVVSARCLLLHTRSQQCQLRSRQLGLWTTQLVTHAHTTPLKFRLKKKADPGTKKLLSG